MSKPKILEQIDNAGGVFIATYGTTTYQEIKDAYDSGKDVICYYNNAIYELGTISPESNTLYFYDRTYSATNNNNAITTYSYLGLGSSNNWAGPFNNVINRINTNIYKNDSTPISSSASYYRPILLSTAEPTSSNGYVGDIWIQYEE